MGAADGLPDAAVRLPRRLGAMARGAPRRVARACGSRSRRRAPASTASATRRCSRPRSASAGSTVVASRSTSDHFLQRFTPRRQRSRWSRINRETAERLIADGRMRPAGLAEVERARADGRWDAAYEGQRSITVPDDLAARARRAPAGEGLLRAALEPEPLRDPLPPARRQAARDAGASPGPSSSRCSRRARRSTRESPPKRSRNLSSLRPSGDRVARRPRADLLVGRGT